MTYPSNLQKMIEESTLPYFVRPTEDGRLALYIDNHLISTHNTCERKFYLQHVMRLRSKGVSGMAMSVGGWWSAVLEDFYNRMKEAQVAESSIQYAKMIGYPTRDNFIEDAAKRWREAKMDLLAVAKPKAYASFGGSAGAALMAMQYYGSQGQLDFQQWKIVAAEEGFGQRGEVLLYEDKEIIVYYMGKPDLVVYTDNGNTLLPVEHKTVERIDKRIQQKYKPHPQITGYVFSLNVIAKSIGYDKPVNRCIVNVAARALPAEKPRDGIKKPRFTRVYPHYSIEELEEWRQNTIAKAKRLHFSLINDEWVWRENSCHLYAGCEYRGVDSVPPGARTMAISNEFVQVEPWSPYSIEEDEEEGE